MSDVEWTNDMVIRLIEEYRKRPELWDSSHDLYRIQIAKYEAWSDIARRFECDIADLRKKLNSVLASHRREKAKVRSGSRSSWFLYPYMTFLPTHVQNHADDTIITNKADSNQNKSSSKIQEQEQLYEDEDEGEGEDENEDYEVVEEVIVKDEPEIESYIQTQTYKQANIRQPKQHNSVKTHGKTRLKFAKKRIHRETNVRQLDSRLLETLRLLRRSGVSRKKDECDSFGEYIADSLRKHDDRTQSMIKQAINNILFEQEMKKYRTEQYTVVIANEDENPLILGNC